jgi:hypothetical protein
MFEYSVVKLCALNAISQKVINLDPTRRRGDQEFSLNIGIQGEGLGSANKGLFPLKS